MKINLTHYVMGGMLTVLCRASSHAQPADSGVPAAAKPVSSVKEMRAPAVRSPDKAEMGVDGRHATS
ncbi:hypothetical protein [Paraburkholderia oxyphila]|uniref:hypothetical protein n=1 Tax=Paraburkholderia oxyphila TaxID=614212 RepID=UPI00047FF6C8|nr:hypothetical protein [Paraburkholderia oxyphila]